MALEAFGLWPSASGYDAHEEVEGQSWRQQGWMTKKANIDDYVREREFFPLRRKDTLYDGEIPFKTERYPFGTDGSQISA